MKNNCKKITFYECQGDLKGHNCKFYIESGWMNNPCAHSKPVGAVYICENPLAIKDLEEKE